MDSVKAGKHLQHQHEKHVPAHEEPDRPEFAIEVTYEGLYELAEETLADGASTLLDQHFGALGGWIAATLVRLGDLRLEFRPAE